MGTPDPTYIATQTDPTQGLTDPVPAGESATTARRAPGQRELSATEREQRQLALDSTVPEKEEAMCGCTRVLHFSVFFDGTGNNRDAEIKKDVQKRALSNIAKLFDAHKDKGHVHARYIPGVGTPYPEIGDTGGTLGMALGKGADKRVRKAIELLDEEIAKIPADVKVLLVNVSVFGFSRGAAEARAFVRDLAATCETDGASYRYKGKPLRVAFAGLYDTVASAWEGWSSALVSANGGHNGWARDMKLPPMVEQCVHMSAAHELRRRFPLDSTRIDAAYPGNTAEFWYPGVHSDVGGGYAPQEQGRENTISRFALNHMYDLAFSAGVLFEKMDNLPGRVRDEFDKDDPELREAFNAYVDAVPLKSGAMERVQAAHMELLHRWLKKRVRMNAELASTKRMQAQLSAGQDERRQLVARQRELAASGRAGAAQPGYEWGQADPAAAAEYEALLLCLRQNAEISDEVQDWLDDLREEDVKYLKDVRDILNRAKRNEQLTLREQTIKKAWDNSEDLPSAVEKFFDLYSHDSVAHFDYDTSRLSDWRTIYFGDTKYKPS